MNYNANTGRFDILGSDTDKSKSGVIGKIKGFFDRLKNRFVVIEVDGIKFFRFSAFEKYAEKKNRQEKLAASRKGKRMFTCTVCKTCFLKHNICDALNILDSCGISDYEITYDKNYAYIKYWATKACLDYKS